MDLNIIKQHKIWIDSFLYLTEMNTSNSLPYHNVKHILDVFKNCYEISFEEELSEQFTIELGVAALFHDFGHSGGKLTDDKNIELAIQYLEGFFISHPKYISDEIVSKDNIINTIKATQFPYVIADENLNDSQRIIRDADMLQTFEDDWISMIMFGLRTEMKRSMLDMIDAQFSFIESMKFNTKYATDKYNALKSKNIIELQILKSFYDKKSNFSFLVKTKDDISKINSLEPKNVSNDIWVIFMNEIWSKEKIEQLLLDKGLSNFELKINETSSS